MLLSETPSYRFTNFAALSTESTVELSWSFESGIVSAIAGFKIYYQQEGTGEWIFINNFEPGECIIILDEGTDPNCDEWDGFIYDTELQQCIYSEFISEDECYLIGGNNWTVKTENINFRVFFIFFWAAPGTP